MDCDIKQIIMDALERVRHEISKQCPASYHVEWISADCCNYYGRLVRNKVRTGFFSKDETLCEILIINPPANAAEMVGLCLEWSLNDERCRDIVTQCLRTYEERMLEERVSWIPNLEK